VDNEAPAPKLGFEGAQLGDTSVGDVAGGHIYQGANADSLVDLLRYIIDKDSQYRLLDLKAREVRQAEVDRYHTAIMAELRLQRLILITGIIILIFVEATFR
jgi:hypothetical protein